MSQNHAQNQKSVEEAAINIILTAKYENTTSTYGDRGIRYVHMEIGHVGQNIHLQAEALNLKTVMIGAFNDKKIQKTLELPKNQKPLYIVPIGHPKN